jgi:hypothetical protein
VDLLPRQVGNYPTLRYWVTGRFRSGTAAFTARHAEPLHHGHHGCDRWCPRLESNQHLLRFRQAPSPDRLRGHCRGRGGARPRASSTIRLSESTFVAQRSRSGTRIRTSTNRVKTCRPAVSRSPSCGECFAIKASDPHVRLLPPVGLEPTHAGLKRRYPTSWVTAAHACGRLVCECGSGRTRTCDGRWAQTGLQPVSFAARMHAPPTRSRNSFPVA